MPCGQQIWARIGHDQAFRANLTARPRTLITYRADAQTRRYEHVAGCRGEPSAAARRAVGTVGLPPGERGKSCRFATARRPAVAQGPVTVSPGCCTPLLYRVSIVAPGCRLTAPEAAARLRLCVRRLLSERSAGPRLVRKLGTI